MSPAASRERPISPELLIRQDDVGVVYLTDDARFDVRCELGEGTVLSPECQTFLSKVRIAEAYPTSYLSGEHRRPWKHMLGEATALAIGGDLEAAEEVLTGANAFLGSRAGEVARMWYVQATVGCVVVLLLLYGIFDAGVQLTLKPSKPPTQTGKPPARTGVATSPKTDNKNDWGMDEDDVYTIKYILLALIGGVVGAGFSLLVRIGKLDIDPAAGRGAHYGEVVYRLTIGALAGFIIMVGWQAGVFASFMKSEPAAVGDAIRASAESFRSNFWMTTTMALAAGASERLVPSLLQQLSDRTVDEKAAATEDKPA